MEARKFSNNSNTISDDNLKNLLELLNNIKYGSVTLVIQDSLVVQVERNDKFRFK